MKEFDNLKDLWQQGTATAVPARRPVKLSRVSVNNRYSLQRQQLRGAVILLLTALYVAALAIFGRFGLKEWYTFFAMGMVVLICLFQAFLLFYTYRQIRLIDDAAPPDQHLRQWEDYYALRKKQAAIIMPAYFIGLNIALGIYFIEVMQGRPLLNITIFLLVYAAWMLFAWFYLGKRILKKEKQKLDGIMNELRSLEGQFD